MANKKLTEIFADNPVTELADDDILLASVDTGSTPASAAIAKSDLFAQIQSESGGDGWTSYSAIVPTRASADDPTYVLTFAGVDLTDTLEEGQPIKWTQNSIVRYGWISSAPAFSTNTTITVLTRLDDASADYDVLDTSSFPITDFAYGMKGTLPFGMGGKGSGWWDLVVTDTSTRVKTSPTDDTWYGETNAMDSGSLPDITFPIGAWKDVSYNVLGRGQVPAASSDFCRTEVTLSTSGNSVSDADFTTAFSLNAGGDGSGLLVSVFPFRAYPKTITVTSKTTYYLLMKIHVTASPTSIQVQGAISTTKIRAMCAYL